MASADVCDDPIVDPAAIGVRAGNFDAVRSACLRSEVEARVDSRALIDTPGFHGTLGGDLQLTARFREGLGVEWGVTVQVVDYTFAQTAVVTASDATYGPFSLHGAVGRRYKERAYVAAYLHTEVPFTRSILDSTLWGTQVAGLVTYDAHRRVALHGRVGGLFWFGSSEAGATSRGAGVISVDAAVRTVRWMDAFAGLELQSGWYGVGLDHLATRIGAHWRIRGDWRVEVAGLVPLAGTERTTAAITVAVQHDR